MSSKDLEFNEGRHKFPPGLKLKNIKNNDQIYDHWKSDFTKSINKCNEKLIKDIEMFKSLISYFQTYELNKKNVTDKKDFDEIKELIYLVNFSYFEYEFTVTANFTSNNKCIKSYHKKKYPDVFYSVDYFHYYFHIICYLSIINN